MRRLKDRSLVPVDDFRYRHATGHTTTSKIYRIWVEDAKAHQRANGLPVPDDFQQQMEDQLCATIPPEYCDRDPGDVTDWVDRKFSWNDLAEGMAVFSRWGTQGAPLVEAGEAERRSHICVSCPLNVGITGCATCRKIAEFITGSVAQQKTPYGDQLEACAICHCALKAM